MGKEAVLELTGNSKLDRYQWADCKIKEIAEKFVDTANIILYDVGSRDNILKPHITTPGVVYRAFDLEPLDKAAEEWDIEKPFPYTYPAPQVITMLEIVEHLKNPWLCLKNIFNTLAPEGYLILTTPNPAWSTSRLHLLGSGYLSCFTESDLELNHHVFTPWPHIIKRLLNDSGFEIVEYSTLDGKTAIFDKNLRGLSMPVQIAARLVKKAVERNDPASCGMSYGIVAKRIE